MLQLIRDKAQSWIAFAIVGMLIIGLSTVAWDAYFSPDPEIPVARINGEKISSNQFQRTYAQQRTRLQQRLGGIDISQFIPDETVFKQNILKQLEDEALILQAAHDSGYRVSDGLLAQQIRNLDVFQTNGQFDAELYEQRLNQNFMSKGEFEDMLRRDVLLQQYRMAVAATGWSTAQEQKVLYKLQEQQRDIAYIIIPAAAYLDQIEIRDEDAQAYYDANAINFATDERVSIEYLELNIADLAVNVDLDENRLQELYQDRITEFGAPEERRTSHILVEVAGDASGEERNSAREKAESILQQIRDGASFAQLARDNSDDLGSASNGGDLGYMSQDSMMDPAFAEAAFSINTGDVSDVIESAYGFHIIKLEDIKTGQTKTFEEVRDELEQDYRRTQAEDIFFEQGEVLANSTFENPDTLEIAAQELDMEIKSTGLFSRVQGDGLALDEAMRATAFSDEVLLQGLNSQPLELSRDRVVVLRVKNHEASSIRPFNEVKPEIIQLLRQQQAEADAKEAGEELLQALSKNQDFEALASERNLEWNHPEMIKRNIATFDPGVVKKAFRMSLPDTNEPSFDGLVLDTGDYALVALFAVKDVDSETIDESVSQAIKAQRERYYGANELQGALSNMRGNAEIIEYPENF